MSPVPENWTENSAGHVTAHNALAILLNDTEIRQKARSEFVTPNRTEDRSVITYDANGRMVRTPVTVTRRNVPRIGVYRGPAGTDPVASPQYLTSGAIGRWEGWLNVRSRYVEDFLAWNDWNKINSTDASFFTSRWANWLLARPDTELVLTVPMLVDTEVGGNSNAEVSAALVKGANGDFNTHYTSLANDILSRGIASQVIFRLGHEQNGGWYIWRAAPNPAAWAKFWRQIVTTIRKVIPNARFLWNPNNGFEQVDPLTYYPGDAYVDWVGPDVYDRSFSGSIYNTSTQPTTTDQNNAWNDIKTKTRGLDWWATFAKDRNKALFVAEYGIWGFGTSKRGGGDNPGFIQNMHDWMHAQPTFVGAVYFEYNADDDHQLQPSGSGTLAWPTASAKFVELYARRPETRRAVASTKGTGTSVGIPRPTGLAVDDTMIMVIECHGDATITWPTDWQEIAPPASTGATSSDVKVGLARKRATAADTGATDFTATLSPSTDYHGVIQAFGGLDPVNPVDVITTAEVDSTAATTKDMAAFPTPPTTDDAVLMLIAAGSLASPGALAGAWFRGHDEVYDQVQSNDQLSVTLTNAPAVGHNYGTRRHTWTAAPAKRLLWGLALRPATRAIVDPAVMAWNRQTGSYTLALTDLGNGVEIDSASAANLTIPPNSSVALPVGSTIAVRQYGVGLVTFVAGSGVTIRSRGNALNMAGQYGEATVTKRGTNEWLLTGDLA